MAWNPRPREARALRVLVIEDDPAIGRLVRLAFEHDGKEVVHALNATQGLQMAYEWGPDVVVLDLMLPDMNGFEVTRKLRAISDVPIVILTARGQEEDRVAGLDLGADDYIVKPFSISELTARVRAITRRAKDDEMRLTPSSLAHRDLCMDSDQYTVHRGCHLLPLTRREFELLRMLMAHPGKLVSRSAISHAVWQRSASAAKNLLDVHMSSLRKKLENGSNLPPYIETVRGEGFRLV